MDAKDLGQGARVILRFVARHLPTQARRLPLMIVQSSYYNANDSYSSGLPSPSPGPDQRCKWMFEMVAMGLHWVDPGGFASGACSWMRTVPSRNQAHGLEAVIATGAYLATRMMRNRAPIAVVPIQAMTLGTSRPIAPPSDEVPGVQIGEDRVGHIAIRGEPECRVAGPVDSQEPIDHVNCGRCKGRSSSRCSRRCRVPAWRQSRSPARACNPIGFVPFTGRSSRVSLVDAPRGGGRPIHC